MTSVIARRYVGSSSPAGGHSCEHYVESVFSDEQAIIELAIAYTWALDTKQLDDLRSVFAPDATADLNGVQCDGQDAIIARIERPLSRLDATQHLVGNHQVHVDGDTATHRCHLHSQHVKRGTPGGDNYLIGGDLRGPPRPHIRRVAHHPSHDDRGVDRRQSGRDRALNAATTVDRHQ